MLPAPSERLSFREATTADASFMLRLLTEPSWARFIRRHEVTTRAEACQYLQDRVISAYGGGLGFWVIELLAPVTPVGICGLIKRDTLDHPDLGFALLEAYWGQGYAREASESVIAYARDLLGLSTLLAISSPDNSSSHALLARLDFVREGTAYTPDGETSVIYRLALEKATVVGNAP